MQFFIFIMISYVIINLNLHNTFLKYQYRVYLYHIIEFGIFK